MTAPEPLHLLDAEHDRIRLHTPEPAVLAAWPEGYAPPIAILDTPDVFASEDARALVWRPEFGIDADDARQIRDWLTRALGEDA